MIKKIIASTAVAGAMTLSSMAATAAPIAFESADRTASPVVQAEEAMSEAWLVVLFGAIAAALIIVIEQKKGPTLPASP